MRRNTISLGRLGLLLLTVLLSVCTTAAQESAKSLEWGEHANFKCRGGSGPSGATAYEIELEDILVGGKSVLIGEPFVADIRDIVFRVKNISDRPIGFIQITVVLPEVVRPPQLPFVRTSPDSKTNPVKPGEEAELRIPSGKIYDWVKDTVAAQGRELQTIKRAAIDGAIVEKSGQPVGTCVKTRDPRNECPLK